MGLVTVVVFEAVTVGRGTRSFYPVDGAPGDNGPRRVRVYFNSALVALGTGEECRVVSSCSEGMIISGDPVGKTYAQLRLERATEIRSTLRHNRRSELTTAAGV